MLPCPTLEITVVDNLDMYSNFRILGNYLSFAETCIILFQMIFTQNFGEKKHLTYFLCILVVKIFNQYNLKIFHFYNFRKKNGFLFYGYAYIYEFMGDLFIRIDKPILYTQSNFYTKGFQEHVLLTMVYVHYIFNKGCYPTCRQE